MREDKNVTISNILRSKEFDEVLSKNPPRSYKIILYSIVLLSVLLFSSLFLVKYPNNIQAKVKIEKDTDSSIHYYIIISDEEIRNISANQTFEIIIGDISGLTKKHNIFKICDNKEHWIFQEGNWIIPICGDLSNIVIPNSNLDHRMCVITHDVPLFYVIF